MKNEALWPWEGKEPNNSRREREGGELGRVRDREEEREWTAEEGRRAKGREKKRHNLWLDKRGQVPKAGKELYLFWGFLLLFFFYSNVWVSKQRVCCVMRLLAHEQQMPACFHGDTVLCHTCHTLVPQEIQVFLSFFCWCLFTHTRGSSPKYLLAKKVLKAGNKYLSGMLFNPFRGPPWRQWTTYHVIRLQGAWKG